MEETKEKLDLESKNLIRKETKITDIRNELYQLKNTIDNIKSAYANKLKQLEKETNANFITIENKLDNVCRILAKLDEFVLDLVKFKSVAGDK